MVAPVPFYSRLKFGNLLVLALVQSPKPIDQLYALAQSRQPNDCQGDWHRVLANDLVKIGEEHDEMWHVRAGLVSGPIPVVVPNAKCDLILYDPNTGHYIGEDGFRVPRNFEEFYSRYPNYLRNWVKKRMGHQVIDEDCEDWSQDLIIYLKYLPQSSKWRKPGANDRPNGCSDVIETFSPIHQYGASERRFRAYINYCLANKFNTVYSKKQKNPICRAGNLSLATTIDSTENRNDAFEVVDDAYCHMHSEVLLCATEERERQSELSMVVHEFRAFVHEKQPELVEIMDALANNGTQWDAAESLGITEALFSRQRNKLKELGRLFLNPKKRMRPRPRGRKKVEPTVEIVA